MKFLELDGEMKRRVLEMAGMNPDDPNVKVEMVGGPVPVGDGERLSPEDLSQRPVVAADRAEITREQREDPAIHARKLLDHLAGYQDRGAHRFAVGDLIQAIPAAPYRFWTAQRPGVVVEVLKEPAFDNEANCGSPDFRLPLDLRVATVRGGRFLIYHVHSGYFEPYRGPVA